MSKFGWSYPPGCSGTPNDEFPTCEVCGLDPDDCQCPECPDCGTAGLASCYRNHALRDDSGASAVMAVIITTSPKPKIMREIIDDWLADWDLVGPLRTDEESLTYESFAEDIRLLVDFGKPGRAMIGAIYDIGTP